MTDVSRLGLDIEAVLKSHPKLRPHGPSRKYLQAYLTNGGFVVGAERCGVNQINLWVPPDFRVWKKAMALGLDVEVKEPFDKPNPDDYGRLSSLAHVNELAYLTLFRVSVKSGADAVSVLEPLLTRI